MTSKTSRAPKVALPPTQSPNAEIIPPRKRDTKAAMHRRAVVTGALTASPDAVLHGACQEFKPLMEAHRGALKALENALRSRTVDLTEVEEREGETYLAAKNSLVAICDMQAATLAGCAVKVTTILAWLDLIDAADDTEFIGTLAMPVLREIADISDAAT